LVAVAGPVEERPESVGRYGRQAVGSGPQRLAQGREGPGRRPVGFRGRRTLDLGQDPFPRRRAIDGQTPAAVAGRGGRQALGVEAGDEVRDGVAGASAGGAGGLLKVVAAGDGQEHDGPRDLGGGYGLGPAELGQGRDLVVGEGPEGILLASGHGGLRVSWSRPSYRRSHHYGHARGK
jgi:hypothetical protein